MARTFRCGRKDPGSIPGRDSNISGGIILSIFFKNRICGVVVTYLPSKQVPRVRFPADAIAIFFKIDIINN